MEPTVDVTETVPPGRLYLIALESRLSKVEVVRRALTLHHPDPAEPVGSLAAVGGLEHAAIAGLVLGAAALRVPVVLDGVIAGSAALVAAALSPDALQTCIAGHCSAEPGHAVALRHLGLRPLIDLELRLGVPVLYSPCH